MSYNKLTIPLKFAMLTKPLLIVLIFYLSQIGIEEVAIGIAAVLSVSSVYLLNRSMNIIHSNIFSLVRNLKVEYVSILVLAFTFFIMNKYKVLNADLLVMTGVMLVYYLAYWLIFPKRVNRLIQLIV